MQEYIILEGQCLYCSALGSWRRVRVKCGAPVDIGDRFLERQGGFTGEGLCAGTDVSASKTSETLKSGSFVRNP